MATTEPGPRAGGLTPPPGTPAAQNPFSALIPEVLDLQSRLGEIPLASASPVLRPDEKPDPPSDPPCRG
jgi:hypothetical protein